MRPEFDAGRISFLGSMLLEASSRFEASFRGRRTDPIHAGKASTIRLPGGYVWPDASGGAAD
jgi:hypothetical protein